MSSYEYFVTALLIFNYTIPIMIKSIKKNKRFDKIELSMTIAKIFFLPIFFVKLI